MLVSSQVFAQVEAKQNVFGIMAGVSSSSISQYNGSRLTGFTGGLYWDWKFSDKYSLQSNFLYSQRGEERNENVSEIELGYLNMPIMIKYKVNEKLSVATGIFADILLVAEGENLDKEELKNDDYGVPVAVGYQITNNIQLGAAYNAGFRNISNSSKWNRLSNSWTSITITYLF